MIAGENMDPEYRKHLLLDTDPLSEQGPSCAITSPLSGDVLVLTSDAEGKESIRASGYAVGANGP